MSRLPSSDLHGMSHSELVSGLAQSQGLTQLLLPNDAHPAFPDSLKQHAYAILMQGHWVQVGNGPAHALRLWPFPSGKSAHPHLLPLPRSSAQPLWVMFKGPIMQIMQLHVTQGQPGVIPHPVHEPIQICLVDVLQT